MAGLPMAGRASAEGSKVAGMDPVAVREAGDCTQPTTSATDPKMLKSTLLGVMIHLTFPVILKSKIHMKGFLSCAFRPKVTRQGCGMQELGTQDKSIAL